MLNYYITFAPINNKTKQNCMKFITQLTFSLLVFNICSLFAQEPQRLESQDSIINVINSSTKGIRYNLSDTGINSELSEVGTSFFMGKYIILSNKKRRHYKTTFNEKTNTFNNNLYCVNVDKDGNLSFPLLFSSAIDSDKNEGAVTFSPNQKTIFYTQENPENHELFDLYKAELDMDSDKYWTNIQKVDVVPAGYSIETPSVSADGKKLYFSSNMPGGLGGYDIYEAPINEDGTLGKVKNLGNNINTIEDEKFPITTTDNKHLYFSSKGHLNLGGFDVFRSSIVNNEYLPALNLGVSLNSRRDDLAFVLVEEDKGYISTDKSSAGNFDILKFQIKHLDKNHKSFQIVEKKSLVALPNAKVIIKDEFGKTLTETISDDKGQIKVEINPVSYNYITVEKEGYEPFSTNFTSEKMLEDPIALVQKKAEIKDDAIVIENILFDFNKASIKEESQLSLNKIIEVLNENPDMKLNIGAHTDSKGSDKYNLALSQKRAKSTVDYLISKGIAKERLTYKGYGESQPLNNCTSCSAEEDQANRRVEFKISK